MPRGKERETKRASGEINECALLPHGSTPAVVAPRFNGARIDGNSVVRNSQLPARHRLEKYQAPGREVQHAGVLAAVPRRATEYDLLAHVQTEAIVLVVHHAI